MMVNAPDFFRFTICGIPELGSHCEAGVTHVLSILDPEWPDPPEFEDYAPHRRMALRFHDIIDPLPGRIAPTRDDVSGCSHSGTSCATPRRAICSCIAMPACRARPPRRR